VSTSDDPKGPFQRLRIEIDPEKLEEASRRLREVVEEARVRLGESVEAGRYTRVRLSYKGKQLGPDLPLSAFLAGQGLALMALGPLWALLGNLGAKAVLEVEFLHEADELVAKGNEAYMHGELESAEALYRDALLRRADDPAALVHLAVLLRVSGRTDEALGLLRRAVTGPEGHPEVVRAAEMLARLSGGRKL
jgi:tetratricopeptide (TPR) repeat protein